MLIGIHGIAGAGKDTICDIIADIYPTVTERIPFAEPVKEAAATFLDVSREQIDLWKNDPNIRIQVVENRSTVQQEIHSDLTMRHVLRLIGHEGRRIFGEDIWLNLNIGNQARTFHWEKICVITDVRYENEAECIRNMGGFVVHVVRPEIDRPDHGSEAGIPEELIDYTIHNDKGLEELEMATRTLLADIQAARPDTHSTHVPEMYH